MTFLSVTVHIQGYIQKNILIFAIFVIGFEGLSCREEFKSCDSASHSEPFDMAKVNLNSGADSSNCKVEADAECNDSALRSTAALEDRLYIRNPLARAVYFKLKEDERNKNDRHVYWYRVILNRLSGNLQEKFVQFDQDGGTEEFLENCQEKSSHLFTQLVYSLARPILNIFMTQTSINGFLSRGSMYIFSKQQLEKLLNLSPYHKEELLLDLGAGDGMVTKQMASYFNTTYATEMSGVMVRRLSSMGYKVLGVDEWQTVGLKYDLISCLNLLDRCDKPLTLLADVKASLKPGTGRVLVAVVIPFKPYVEFESKTHTPTEYIHIRGGNFEDQIQHFSSVFHNAGYEVEKFTRMPYLCEGDLRHSFYVLSDALFVLKPIETGS